ncbi:hypothetical protein AAVH_19870 [Aphelenchoides avenae]|nr:hypothetical protein AAVH_19870 [Aphelenchus avenae]
MNRKEPNDEPESAGSESPMSTVSDADATGSESTISDAAGSGPPSPTSAPTISDAIGSEPPSPTSEPSFSTISDAIGSEPPTISESDPDWELATYELRAHVGDKTFTLMQSFQELEEENRALTACQAVADVLLSQRKENAAEAFQRATQLQEELDGLKTKMEANNASRSTEEAEKSALREELKQHRSKILALTVKLLSKSTAKWAPDPVDLRRKVDQLREQIATLEQEQRVYDFCLNATTAAIASTVSKLEQKSAEYATTVANIGDMRAKLREVEGPSSTLMAEAAKASAYEDGRRPGGTSDRKRHEQHQSSGDRSMKRRRTRWSN